MGRFSDRWDEKYPAISPSRRKDWDRLTVFLVIELPYKLQLHSLFDSPVDVPKPPNPPKPLCPLDGIVRDSSQWTNIFNLYIPESSRFMSAIIVII